jgi:hypothetical protein
MLEWHIPVDVDIWTLSTLNVTLPAMMHRTISQLHRVWKQLELSPSRMRQHLHMLVPYACACIDAAVEDRKMLALQTPQHVPQCAQISKAKRGLLRLKFNRMDHELRAHDTEFIEYELVTWPNEAEAKVRVVVCEGIGDSLLVSGSCLRLLC